ncbi:unnamed protein product [Brassicogethes aeneus]|uniref:BED-type domain-containing protein n=1 Tax=Brassicogethes aeneus TaxID=1431903 RepID=A0A9P0B665_BRAAE|nr:unnamed protein product [Brassicogethes aeneus]
MSSRNFKQLLKDLILDYYTPSNDKKFMTCKACKKNISRGNAQAHKSNTTNCVDHLKIKAHSFLYAEYKEKKTILKMEEIEHEATRAESAKTNRDCRNKIFFQETLSTCINKTQKWGTDDNRAKKLDKLVLEMIAMGNYPFTIANETGFLRVINFLEPRAALKSDKYYREQLDPTYGAVKDKIKEIIKAAQFISFTTDVWTNKSSTTSLMSLKSHYVVPEKMTRLKVILAATPLHDNHTSEYLKGKLQNIIKDYETMSSCNFKQLLKDLILDYYTPSNDKKFMTCKACKKNISRGNAQAHKANTTNCVDHLKIKAHSSLYAEYKEKKTILKKEEIEHEATRAESAKTNRDCRNKIFFQETL